MKRRTDRLGELIKQELSLIFMQNVNDPRLSLVTLTQVKITEDLRIAKVYYFVEGEEVEKSRALKGLNSAKGFIKRELSKKLSLRFMPDINFCYDNSIEKGMRIEEILKSLKDD